MSINRKMNDSLVEKYGDYVHLYPYLNKIEREDENEGGIIVEYEGPLIVMSTTLDLAVLEDYMEALIAFAPALSTGDAALSYLNRTDYTVIKCTELGLSMTDEYPEIHTLRTIAREIARLEGSND